MARFRGTVQGRRGIASRLGTDRLTVAANGWDRGVMVEAFVDPVTGLNTFDVWLTTGSSDGGYFDGKNRKLIGRFI